MNYFKVKTGYAPEDYISIEESELTKALKAQITGGVVIFKTGIGSVGGNSIISITPDYNKELGFNHGYSLLSEDFGRLSDSRVKEYQSMLLEASESVQRDLKGLPPAPQNAERIGSGSNTLKNIADKFRIGDGK